MSGEDTRTVLIVANHARQAAGWARENGVHPARWRLVQRPDDVHGRRAPHVRVVVLSFPRDPSPGFDEAWRLLCDRTRFPEGAVEHPRGRWTDYDGPGDTYRAR